LFISVSKSGYFWLFHHALTGFFLYQNLGGQKPEWLRQQAGKDKKTPSPN